MGPQPFPVKTKRQGFAAVLSVVVVSAIALIIGLTAVASYLAESHLASDRIAGIQVRSAAFSCADIAMLRLKLNNAYTGNENVSVDKVACHIEQVVVSGDARTVYARATLNDQISRIKVEVADINEFFLSSWQDVQP